MSDCHCEHCELRRETAAARIDSDPCRCDDCETGRDNDARAQGAAEERAAIVEFIRELTTAERSLSAASCSLLQILAAQVERGDYIKQETKPNE